jgi:hypothetical protein
MTLPIFTSGRAIRVAIGFVLLGAAHVGCGGASNQSAPGPPTGGAPAGGATAVGGTSAAGASSAPTSKLDFVRITQGAACVGDCTTVVGVEAPATLVLEDAAGKLAFDIEPGEFRVAEELARDPKFAKIVADSLAGEDCFGFDAALSMAFKWEGQSAQEVPHLDSCGVTEGYVTRDLVQYLTRLKERYLVCPAWVEPPGFQLAVDPLPQRALCWFCYGRCKGESP